MSWSGEAPLIGTRTSPSERRTRSARTQPQTEDRAIALNQSKGRALLIDLNNFSTFPTLAVGILVANLRGAGYQADVISPLAYDVPAAERERRERITDHLARRVHLSTRPTLCKLRDTARATRRWWKSRPHPRVLEEARKALEGKPDVFLLSAYLQHYPTVVELGRLAQAKRVPLVLGGPVFNMQDTANAWRSISGLAAIVGGEVDLTLHRIIDAVCAGEDLLQFDGVMLPDGRTRGPAPPLRDLDRSPIPDFTDFPWDKYRVRIVPLMTGRGCQWNRCVFCSDIVSASGRTFRTRSVESVLAEMEEQSRRHQTLNFLFLDLKLNSNPAMFRGIIENIQRRVPGAEWIGTVHVDQRKDNGLSRRDLRDAVVAGMRRVSFGLESGSQRMLDAMDKGCTVESNAEFIRTAYEAGLSVRCTMFKGFPGETPDDLIKTAEFLERHAAFIDRVRFNEFSVLQDTPIYRDLTERPSKYPQLRILNVDHRFGGARYANADSGSAAYRRAKRRVLAAVYGINRREVRPTARAFDGLM